MRPDDALNARPVLGTPSQLLVEKTLIGLLDDPELKRIQGQLRAELAATARGQTRAGATSLNAAISQWTNSMGLAEIGNFLPLPSQVWITDDTPREWFGHHLSGAATSGDNPDVVYRAAFIDGGQRFEVIGQFDMARRPAQLNIELHHGNKVTPPAMEKSDGSPPAMDKADVIPLVSITDRDMQITPDGSFRITVGPSIESAVHLKSSSGRLTLGSRDVLADWEQRPCWMQLRSLDGMPPRHLDLEQIRQAIYRDLPTYVRFWAKYPDVWFGGLSGNQVAPAQGRNGSMAGFLTGFSWRLAPGQALIIRTDPAGAAYTGFQIMDPWMIGPDAKKFQVSLNLAQTKPNADGTFTFVLSHEDPGVSNWLDTTGLDEGFGLIRWQAVPPGATVDAGTLVRDFRVLPLCEVDAMRELARVTPEQRKAQLAARLDGYNKRTL